MKLTKHEDAIIRISFDPAAEGTDKPVCQIIDSDGNTKAIFDGSNYNDWQLAMREQDIPWASRDDEPNNVKDNLAKERAKYEDLNKVLKKKIYEARKREKLFRDKYKEAEELANELREELINIERVDQKLSSLMDDYSLEEEGNQPLA